MVQNPICISTMHRGNLVKAPHFTGHAKLRGVFHHRHRAAMYKNLVDFQSSDVIMIEKPNILGKYAECLQNVHLMFVECSMGIGYIISKESYGFLVYIMYCDRINQ